MPDPTTPEAADWLVPDASDRVFRIPIELPDGRIVLVRKCDIRLDDRVAFIDSRTLPPWSERTATFCSGGQPVMVYTPPGALIWEDENEKP